MLCGICLSSGPQSKKKRKEKKRKRNIDKSLDLARELKKLWNMKVIVIPIVDIVLGTAPKGLGDKLRELEIIGRNRFIQNTALLKSARFLIKIPGELIDSS